MPNEQINLSDALDQINSIKTDLGTVLNEQGMTVTNEFASYPTAVSNRTKRYLTFPINTNTTRVLVKNTVLLNNLSVYTDDGTFVASDPYSICVVKNGVIRNITAAKAAGLSVEKMETPVNPISNDYTYNTSAANFVFRTNKTKYQISPYEEGYVQFKVTDNATGLDYYINCFVKNLDLTTDISNARFLRIDESTGDGVELTELTVGDNVNLYMDVIINNDIHITENSSSIYNDIYNNVSDNLFESIDPMNVYYMHNLYGSSMTRFEITSSDTSILTVDHTPAEDNDHPDNVVLHAVSEGNVDIYYTAYDENNNELWQTGLGITVNAS